MKNALANGWRVRLCFDPIILAHNWFETYSKFFKDLFIELDYNKIQDVTLGVFRMNKDYFNKIRKRDTRSNIYFSKYAIEKGAVVVERKERVEAMNKIQNILTEGRSKIEVEVQEIAQLILDEYGSGIQLTQVQTQQADPPEQVIDAFRDVQAARADRERSKNWVKQIFVN